MKITLACTCERGGSEGLVQEVVEKRIATRTGMPVTGVHALLDLFETVLDEVLNVVLEEAESEHEKGDGMESARLLAERSGIPLEEVTAFLTLWEEVVLEVDEEGLTPRTGDFLGIPRSK